MSPNRPVKAVETMFKITDVLRNQGTVGVTELAEHVGMQKGSVHHHLSTMQEYGYVVKEGGKYRLGAEFLSIGMDIRNQYPIYSAAKNEIRKLAEKTGETAWCAIEENGRGIFIYGYSEGSTINVDSVLGTWFPLHCNSAGKAILSCFSHQRIDSIIDRHGLTALTENTITTREELFKTLETIRDQRYALNMEEDIKGIHAIGIPIIGEDSTPAGAISVGGTANRLTREYCEEELAPEVLITADNIELNLVYG